MSFKYNFWFKFCAVAIFLFCEKAVFSSPIDSNNGGTLGNQTGYYVQTVSQAKDIAISAAGPSTTPQGQGSTQTICPQGQYVYKCGNHRVGFNWLKSATFPNPDPQPNTLGASKTKNYYVGDTPMELFEQMRNFFSGTSTVLYFNNNSIASVSPESDRELILDYLCHPAISTITCALCPNNANVPESTVELDNDNKTIDGTWKFHTFADCYMEEFEDSTGTYHYKPQNTDGDQSAKCYYTNTNSNALNALNGDEIGNFVPGLNVNTIKNTEVRFLTITN